MEETELKVEREGPVLWLRFNRPERKNALTLAIYSAAADALEEAKADPQVRVVALEGTGGCFSAGNDLADFMQAPEIAADHPVVRFMEALRACPQPLVASVRGAAVGIGTTLLLHCDLAYASADAYFQLPFVNLGLCPEFAASYLLPRLVGHTKAAELLLLGERFDAGEARTMGLLNAVASESELDALVEQKLARLVAQPPAAVRRSKALLKQHQESGIASAMNAELVAFAEGLQSPECHEALEAFFAKRAPDFSRFQ